ncbi:MAG: hypothetical protein ACK41D_05115 [Rubricoccaceae bacterium]
MSAARARGGCARHALVLGALCLLALGLVVGRYHDVFGLAYRNTGAMGEGAEEARALRTPEDLLAWMARHPERASLVVLDLGEPARDLRFRADAERAVVGLPMLWTLAEAARRGATTPPGTDTLAALALPVRRERAPGAAPPPPASGDTRRALVRARDEVADALLLRFGAETVAALPAALGLRAEGPLPMAGLFMTWDAAAEPESREAVRAAAVAHAARLVADPAARAAVHSRFRAEGLRLDLPAQRARAAATLPRGTAEAYAHLLARALTDSLFSPAASAAFRGALERKLPDGGHAAAVSRAFPGHLAFAGYVRLEGAAPRVAVLVLEDVPMAVFYHLSRTGLDAGLALQLLTEADYLEAVRGRLP